MTENTGIQAILETVGREIKPVAAETFSKEKSIKADFGVMIDERHAKVLDGYTGAKIPEHYDSWRSVMYNNWGLAVMPDNFDEWIKAVESAGLIDEEGKITLYRGWHHVDGISVEDRPNTSWTLDRRVAEWHATLHDYEGHGELATLKVPATYEEFEHFFIWGCDGYEAEVICHHEILDELGWTMDIQVEILPERPKELLCDLTGYIDKLGGPLFEVAY